MRSLDNQLFIQVVRRSNWICERCKAKPADTIHHIRLRSNGGKDTLANLLHVCRNCHAIIHPWLRRMTASAGRERVYHGILATVFKPERRQLNNVIVLERYTQTDILSVYREIAQKTQTEKRTGCP